jgi:hypothetical protein
MRSSTVIARILVNAGASSLDEAESMVRAVFEEEFSNSSFDEWNRDVDDQEAERWITNVGRSSINISNCIRLLSREAA